MTTINFPSSPSLDQIYSFSGKRWIWNGVGWVALTAPRASDAELRDRATHTGTQAMSTVSGLEDALVKLVANSQAGASYTLALSDAGKRVGMTSGSANAVTVPANATAALPIDSIVFVSQDGAGATTIAAAGGVTINTSEGLKVGGRYKMVSLVKTATNTWMAIGTVA